MPDPCAPAAFAFDSPSAALGALFGHLQAVGEQTVPLHEAVGRVLSRPIQADRDSPPHDASAMDGYAVRLGHIEDGRTLRVQGEVAIGQPPPEMPATGCLQISTGACVPAGCDAVIPREQVEEGHQQIKVPGDLTVDAGQHIRRRGENLRQGEPAVSRGVAVDAPVAAALATFGRADVGVYRRVRVSLLTTGNELQDVGAAPAPWQIRDSNTSALLAGMSRPRWIDVVSCQTIGDDLPSIAAALHRAARGSDLIVTTGGVSMGDHDYLKPALTQAGGRAVYHKLPIRPGKPSLGGVVPDPGDDDRMVALVALPGNPVAVAVGVPLLVGPVARMLAGYTQPLAPRPTVEIENPPKRKLGLWRYLPARWVGDGKARVLSTRGSGDMAGAAAAALYVQLPPNAEGPGPWVFYDVGL